MFLWFSECFRYGLKIRHHIRCEKSSSTTNASVNNMLPTRSWINNLVQSNYFYTQWYILQYKPIMLGCKFFFIRSRQELSFIFIVYYSRLNCPLNHHKSWCDTTLQIRIAKMHFQNLLHCCGELKVINEDKN